MVSKVEIEEKYKLDTSSYEDLPKVGAYCNGIEQVDCCEEGDPRMTCFSTSESTAELDKSQEHQIMVPWATECKLPGLEVEKVKSEEETELESAREEKESLESQITITESAESEYYQLDNGEGTHAVENKTDFDVDVNENQESDIMVTYNVDIGLVQGEKATKLANGTDVSLETEIANHPVPYRNKDCSPSFHVEDGRAAVASRSKTLDGSVVNSKSGLNLFIKKVTDQFYGGDENGDDKLTCQETKDIEGSDRLGSSTFSPEGSGADALDGNNVCTDNGERPFRFLIKIPRYDDEKLREQIRHAQLQVDEKTQLRDAIRSEIQMKRANFQDYHNNYEAAKSEERAAQGLVKSKRQEIDAVQSITNMVKNAILQRILMTRSLLIWQLG
ncbi:hypothetical protein F0562_036212 [Nyssa sinensis]|uniref:Uncharacterized protein n=1 Tax=Nyssa sinensis TaxID=561372 RepID=A0A5J5AHB7_9ASTE|nr:hypothetical protein F0562_036212 [Nyssa sinensis]